MKLLKPVSTAALAAALTIAAAAAEAQAPETQTQTSPAPAEAQANTAAGQANSAGPANSSAAAAGTGGVEEIVVTAQFREQNLQRTPLAITAVSGAMLEARSQTNIAQVANQAPSVTIKPQGAAFGPSIIATIRGIGQYDFNPALEPGVGLYIDDVYYATLTGSLFDLLDLDRVEILRGPQGTLAGRNSIGGAVKLFSKKPTGSNTGYLMASYGSRNRIDLRGSADIKLTDDLSARISGVAKKQDGYIKRLDFGCIYPAGASNGVNPAGGVPALVPANSNCLLARDGDVGYNALRGQLRYQASDAFEINLAADYEDEDHKTAGGVLRYATPPVVPGNDVNPYAAAIPYDSRFLCGRYCNYATFLSPADGPFAYDQQQDRVRFKGWGVSGTIDWKLADDLSVKSITAYRRYVTSFGNDDDFSPMTNSLGFSQLHFHQFSQELRLNGAFANNAIEYTLGGFYFDQRSIYYTIQDLRYAGLPAFVGDDGVPASSKAVFAQATGHISEALSVIGGIRYTKDKKDYTFSRLTPAGTPHPVLGGLNGVTGRFSGDRVDYRINAQYQVTPDAMVYGQFSTGYKGGGINPRPFIATQVRSFDPETVGTWEAGFKTSLLDRAVRLNAAAFYSTYKNIQIALLSCPQYSPVAGFPCALPTNAGNAHIKGVEAELNARPTQALTIDGSVSYVNFHYYKVDTVSTGVTSSMITPYNPRWKWSIGVQYEIDLADAGSVTPRIDAAYQSHVFGNAVNGPLNRIPGYTLANARLTWANVGKDLEVSAEVTNLFDKYYFLSNFDLTGAGAGTSSDQPGRPREWALTVKKKF